MGTQRTNPTLESHERTDAGHIKMLTVLFLAHRVGLGEVQPPGSNRPWHGIQST